jgi:histidinol-phosphate aminotransferase
LIDEAYYGFCDYTLDIARLIKTYDNVVFSRTFSKFYGLANLRIGYGFCSSALKQVLWLDMPLHRLPHIVKRMGIAALEDDAYYDDVRAKILRAREKFSETLNQIEGVRVLKSDTNFVYIRLVGYDAEKIRQIAADNGYLIRIFMGNEEKHLRITIGTEEMMEELAGIMVRAFADAKIS